MVFYYTSLNTIPLKTKTKFQQKCNISHTPSAINHILNPARATGEAGEIERDNLGS
jgi:hypothetical protein